ncbi:hypothetical protein [Hominifimenecus sp. rT4P-3]|uniref:hypothetical protein n=1 Tax=Hominifimenecus sp. rT4P-3 TaxID=3242979 RepID=UPI003DA6A1FA
MAWLLDFLKKWWILIVFGLICWGFGATLSMVRRLNITLLILLFIGAVFQFGLHMYRETDIRVSGEGNQEEE